MRTRKEQIITHKTRRFQQDIEDEFIEEGELSEGVVNIPVNVTIEAAIHFYEQNAEGEYATLYQRTATWLKMLFKSNVMKDYLTSRSATDNEAVKAFLEARQDVKDAETEKEGD